MEVDSWEETVPVQFTAPVSAALSSVLVMSEQRKPMSREGRGQAAAVSEDLQVSSDSGSVLMGPS